MSKPTIVDRERVLAALTDQWGALIRLTDTLGDEQWQTPSVLPGWRIADIIAHVVGTESHLAGRKPDVAEDFSMPNHVRNPIGELNERWVGHFADRSRTEMLEAFEEIVSVRTAELEQLDQAEFDKVTMTPAGEDTYGRFMRIRVFDCWVHDLDIRDSIGWNEPTDPLPIGWVIAEIAASLPYVIGKRAQAPEGTKVRIDVTGPGGTTLSVAVAERAELVDRLAGPPDVVLRLSAAELARLVGGRTSADPEAVIIGGDRELGSAIVAGLHYMV